MFKLEQNKNNEQDCATDNEEDSEMDTMKQIFQSIDGLQEFGINASDIGKLKDNGFATIGQLFQVSQRKLLQVKGISEAKLEKILAAGAKVKIFIKFYPLHR